MKKLFITIAAATATTIAGTVAAYFIIKKKRTEVEPEKTEIEKFEDYLTENGRDNEEVKSIIENIKMIEERHPDKVNETMEKIREIMSSESFDLEKTMKFDNDNFMLVYGSMDPLKMSMFRYGFFIEKFDEEKSKKLFDIFIKLYDLKRKDLSEFATQMYEVYHIFESVKDKEITEDTYDNFKKYAEKCTEEVSESKEEIE